MAFRTEREILDKHTLFDVADLNKPIDSTKKSKGFEKKQKQDEHSRSHTSTSDISIFSSVPFLWWLMYRKYLGEL